MTRALCCRQRAGGQSSGARYRTSFRTRCRKKRGRIRGRRRGGVWYNANGRRVCSTLGRSTTSLLQRSKVMADSHSTSVPAVQQFKKRGNRYIDLTGQRFGRLVALRDSGERRRGRVYWVCLCDCGQETIVKASHLRGGVTRSCGCLHDECSAHLKRTHGLSHLPEYKAWAAMIGRCTNSRHQSHHYYGARGIRVCGRWTNFEAFYDDMGVRPSPKHTLERVDNSLGYSPDNCVWATQKQQLRNKRNNRLVTHQGTTRPLVEWAEEIGIRPDTLRCRLRLGWSVERALTEPVHPHSR